MTNELANTNELKAIMRGDEIKSRFAEVVGNSNAGGYISSVLIAVSENKSLQECTTTSIIGAALRAATLRLSVDPTTGQAYLVPFKGKATLVVGYHGIYHMAIRTGKYRFINLITVYEGESVVENRMTGLHTLEGGPTNKDNILGYMLYFRLLSGFEKTFYMTCDELEAHGARYSKTYNYDTSLWKTNKQAMFKKTVIRMGLLKWGYLDPSDVQSMQEVDETPIEVNIKEIDTQERAPQSVNQNLKELGYSVADEEPPVYIEPVEEQEPEPEKADEPEYQPEQITSSVFWKKVKELKMTNLAGQDVLTKQGGDYAAALHELNKKSRAG